MLWNLGAINIGSVLKVKDDRVVPDPSEFDF